MLKEVSQDQLLRCFVPSRGVGLALLPSTRTFLYFFLTSLHIYHIQINQILLFRSCRTMFCRRPVPGENNPERRRLHLVCSRLRHVFSEQLSSNGSSLAIFELLSLHCPGAVRPPWPWLALHSWYPRVSPVARSKSSPILGLKSCCHWRREQNACLCVFW